MAITFDSASSGSVNGTTLTVSHTVSGTDTILIVSYGQRTNPTTLTTIKYAGTSMTLFDSQYPIVGYQAIYYLLNPTTGTNDIVVTTSSTRDQVLAATSYTGVLQTSTFDVSAKHTSASTDTISETLTTTVNGVWILAGGIDNTMSQTAQTGTTKRAGASLNIIAGLYDNNISLSPPGDYSIGYNLSLAQECGIIALTIKPVSFSYPSGFFMLI